MNFATYTMNNKLDFLRQNNRSLKKEKKRKKIKLRGVHIFLIILTFSFIATGIFFAGQFLLSWEKLNIKSIVLVNSDNISGEKIEKIVRSYSGNILGTDLSEMRRELLEIPQLKDVSISRILPSRLRIEFQYRQGILQLQHKGRFKIIDNEGVIIDQGRAPIKDLIVVKNIAEKDVAHIVPHLNELKSIRPIIEYVSYVRPFGVVLKLKGKNTRVYPGETEYKKRLSYYFKVKAKMLKNRRIKTIDLRFKNRIYIEFEKSDLVSKNTEMGVSN